MIRSFKDKRAERLVHGGRVADFEASPRKLRSDCGCWMQRMVCMH